MKTYHKIIEEADSYTRMVVAGFKKKKFDNKFLLSLVTMSLEKFMVAFLMAKADLPNSHTLTFLIEEMIKYTEVDESIVESIIGLDEKIQLCSIEIVEPYIPTDTEMESILLALKQIQNLVKEETSYSEIV